MVMLREELPGKEDDPTPELDMLPICAVAEEEDAFLSQVPVAAEKKRDWLLRQRLRQGIDGERRRFSKAGEARRGKRAIDGGCDFVMG
jgi:hypothetical protein